MKQAKIIEAAALIETLNGVKELRATMAGNKDALVLHLYAYTEAGTMLNDTAVDSAIHPHVLDWIIIQLETRLNLLGVE